MVLGGDAWLGGCGGRGHRACCLVVVFLWWAPLRGGAVAFMVGDVACVMPDIEDCWWGWSKRTGFGLHGGGCGGAAVTPHVSKPHDYVNHMFMRP
jgi:hypothetical protein